ncbi:hypothetical protein [Terrisporobacter glycolicus]|nr:hypothetical protein [Terrisporobacter glycolicus]
MMHKNKNKAKAWRDKISKEIYSDINNHPKSSLDIDWYNVYMEI